MLREPNTLALGYIQAVAADSPVADQGAEVHRVPQLALPRLRPLHTSDKIGPRPLIHSSNKKPCPSPRDPL